MSYDKSPDRFIVQSELGNMPNLVGDGGQFSRGPLFFNIYPNARFYMGGTNATVFSIYSLGEIADLRVYGKRLTNFIVSPIQAPMLTTILGAENLTGLRDEGTAPSVYLVGHPLTAETLDQFFTDLPETSLTASINITGTLGVGGCDPSIATAKGYTVITS